MPPPAVFGIMVTLFLANNWRRSASSAAKAGGIFTAVGLLKFGGILVFNDALAAIIFVLVGLIGPDFRLFRGSGS